MKRYLQRLNLVLEFVEANILSDIDYHEISKLACCPTHQFNRIFSFTLDMTLPEYVRKRRLTLAAQEILTSGGKIIDIAQKYGYESHAAFTRAFKEHHGIPPGKTRANKAQLNLFMPIKYHIPISLSQDINYRFEEGEMKMAKLLKKEIVSFGPYRAIGKEIRTKAKSQDISALWISCFSDGTYEKLLELKDYIVPEAIGDEYISCVSEPDDDGRFSYLVGMIMKEDTPVPEGFSYRDIPSCTVCKAQIEGEEYDIYSNEFRLTKAAIIENGYKLDSDNFYAFEVYTDEKFGIPKNRGEKKLILDYYLTCKPNN